MVDWHKRELSTDEDKAVCDYGSGTYWMIEAYMDSSFTITGWKYDYNDLSALETWNGNTPDTGTAITF